MATSRESNPNHNTPTLILKARMVGRVRHSRARWPPRYMPVRGRYRRYCDRTCKGRESRGVKVDATHAPDKVDHRRRRGYSRCYWRPPAWWYIVGMLMLVAEGEAAGEAGGEGEPGGQQPRWQWQRQWRAGLLVEFNGEKTQVPGTMIETGDRF